MQFTCIAVLQTFSIMSHKTLNKGQVYFWNRWITNIISFTWQHEYVFQWEEDMSRRVQLVKTPLGEQKVMSWGKYKNKFMQQKVTSTNILQLGIALQPRISGSDIIQQYSWSWWNSRDYLYIRKTDIFLFQADFFCAQQPHQGYWLSNTLAEKPLWLTMVLKR